MIHVLLIVFTLGSSPDLVMVETYIQVLQILIVQLPRPGKYCCCFCGYVNNKKKHVTHHKEKGGKKFHIATVKQAAKTYNLFTANVQTSRATN